MSAEAVSSAADTNARRAGAGRPTSLPEAIGLACGLAMGPLFAVTSIIRRARTFHPRGAVYAARVTVDGACPAYPELAVRVAGPALVRLSGALWKRAERLDVLGCAIRFRHEDRGTSARDRSDQDLLFATIRRPWTMPLAPLLTDARDYLGNDYFAVSPFEVDHVGRLFFRLRPDRTARPTGSRRERLEDAVKRGDARLHLEGSPGPWGPWRAIALIELRERTAVDDEALRFDPFADGRGIHPVGWVHSLRRGVYAMSQRARPRSGGTTPR